jgi:hypothetical protein
MTRGKRTVRSACAIAILCGLAFLRTELHADQPSHGQCICLPSTEQGASDQYSTIDNASLCVGTTTQGARPLCNITVYCLSDGTGKGCPAYKAGLKAASIARSKPEDFIEPLRSFAGGLAEALQAYPSTLPISPEQIGKELVAEWNRDALRKCMAGFDAGQSRRETGKSIDCASTPSSQNLSIEFLPGESTSVTVQLVRGLEK